MTDEKVLQILQHRKEICNKYVLCSCDECEEECIYPNVINALEEKIKGAKNDKD